MTDFKDMLKQSLNIYVPIYHSSNNYVVNIPYEHKYNSKTGLISSSYCSEDIENSSSNHYSSYYFSFGSVTEDDFDMSEFSDYKLID